MSEFLWTTVKHHLDNCPIGGSPWSVGRHANDSKAGRRPADKFDERRRELAESALVTLGELGYARTSLREIASHSEFSHGVLHYYFSDKLELIIFCVRYYKARCVHRYDEVVERSATADELLDGFAAKLAETIVEEAPMHRLWYDLRSQSMFEESLREAVTTIDRTLEQMVWRVITRYATSSAPRSPPRRRWPTDCSTGSSSRHCSATRPATRRPSTVSRTRCGPSWTCCSGARSQPERRGRIETGVSAWSR